MAEDAQRVVVYVPAADARRLRAAGFHPAVWVRERVREALAAAVAAEKPKLDRPVALPGERSQPVAVGAQSEIDPVAVATQKQKSARPPAPPGSAACGMVVPRGTRCKACGKTH